MGKKMKEVWRAEFMSILNGFWKGMNRIAFEDEVLSNQNLKSPFVYLLW